MDIDVILASGGHPPEEDEEEVPSGEPGAEHRLIPSVSPFHHAKQPPHHKHQATSEVFSPRRDTMGSADSEESYKSDSEGQLGMSHSVPPSSMSSAMSFVTYTPGSSPVSLPDGFGLGISPLMTISQRGAPIRSTNRDASTTNFTSPPPLGSAPSFRTTSTSRGGHGAGSSMSSYFSSSSFASRSHSTSSEGPGGDSSVDSGDEGESDDPRPHRELSHSNELQPLPHSFRIQHQQHSSQHIQLPLHHVASKAIKLPLPAPASPTSTSASYGSVSPSTSFSPSSPTSFIGRSRSLSTPRAPLTPGSSSTPPLSPATMASDDSERPFGYGYSANANTSTSSNSPRVAGGTTMAVAASAQRLRSLVVHSVDEEDDDDEYTMLNSDASSLGSNHALSSTPGAPGSIGEHQHRGDHGGTASVGSGMILSEDSIALLRLNRSTDLSSSDSSSDFTASASSSSLGSDDSIPGLSSSGSRSLESSSSSVRLSTSAAGGKRGGARRTAADGIASSVNHLLSLSPPPPTSSSSPLLLSPSSSLSSLSGNAGSYRADGSLIRSSTAPSSVMTGAASAVSLEPRHVSGSSSDAASHEQQDLSASSAMTMMARRRRAGSLRQDPDEAAEEAMEGVVGQALSPSSASLNSPSSSRPAGFNSDLGTASSLFADHHTQDTAIGAPSSSSSKPQRSEKKTRGKRHSGASSTGSRSNSVSSGSSSVGTMESMMFGWKLNKNAKNRTPEAAQLAATSQSSFASASLSFDSSSPYSTSTHVLSTPALGPSSVAAADLPRKRSRSARLASPPSALAGPDLMPSGSTGNAQPMAFVSPLQHPLHAGFGPPGSFGFYDPHRARSSSLQSIPSHALPHQGMPGHNSPSSMDAWAAAVAFQQQHQLDHAAASSSSPLALHAMHASSPAAIAAYLGFPPGGMVTSPTSPPDFGAPPFFNEQPYASPPQYGNPLLHTASPHMSRSASFDLAFFAAAAAAASQSAPPNANPLASPPASTYHPHAHTTFGGQLPSPHHLHPASMHPMGQAHAPHQPQQHHYATTASSTIVSTSSSSSSSTTYGPISAQSAPAHAVSPLGNSFAPSTSLLHASTGFISPPSSSSLLHSSAMSPRPAPMAFSPAAVVPSHSSPSLLTHTPPTMHNAGTAPMSVSFASQPSAGAKKLGVGPPGRNGTSAFQVVRRNSVAGELHPSAQNRSSVVSRASISHLPPANATDEPDSPPSAPNSKKKKKLVEV